MDESLKQLTAPLAKAFKQHHITITVIIVALILGFAVFRLYEIVVISTSQGVDGYTPVSKANGTFDPQTVEAIKNLRSSKETDPPLKFPSRPSPFVE